MERTERQAHGFTFEDYISDRYGVNLTNKIYTDKWDGELNGRPVSIKHTKKGNAVDLADIFRQATVDEDFYMFVGFYTDKDNHEIDDIHILYIPKDRWLSYFMKIEDFKPIFKNALDSVTNDKKDDALWSQLRDNCKKLWKENTPGIITPNGKRDHKKQKRWQCSINKINFFKELVPNYEINESEINNYAKRDKE